MAEKPKRARRTRKAPDADAVVQDAPVEDAPAEAPKPRTRRRKPRQASGRGRRRGNRADRCRGPGGGRNTDAGVAEPVAVQDPAPEEASRRPRKELPADEIVVSSSTAPETEQPKKKGW